MKSKKEFMSYKQSSLAQNEYLGGPLQMGLDNIDPFQEIQYSMNNYDLKSKKSMSPDKKMVGGFRLENNIH